jgi:alkanesulfonate monooxygenase SsuD/methylene tetrahydromethanopterin reductase-like flavin-dependent oxidoreductase (luciferase family)
VSPLPTLAHHQPTDDRRPQVVRLWNGGNNLRGLGRSGVAPAVRGSVAEQSSCLLDREQRVVLSDVAAYLDVGIELCDQGGVGSRHHGVRVRNDEDLGSGQIRFEGQTDGLRRRDFFGIGEHHTDDIPLSAADVVLGAIAARTTRIRLGSAVTVLSSDDPVRVFQRYSTLNAVSSGRAEVILGRGSSIDSFPLFGYDLADYEEPFEQKTTLSADLLKGGPVTWEGTTRASLRNQDVVPHTESEPFPVWIGVGGSPQSVIRAARLGFSLILAIIGGSRRASHPSPGSSGRHWNDSDGHRYQSECTRPDTSLTQMRKHAKSSGRTTCKSSAESARHADSPSRPRGPSPMRSGHRGALNVGSPETVAHKIAANLTALGATRFDLKYGMGGLSHQAPTSSSTAPKSSHASANS